MRFVKALGGNEGRGTHCDSHLAQDALRNRTLDPLLQLLSTRAHQLHGDEDVGLRKGKSEPVAGVTAHGTWLPMTLVFKEGADVTTHNKKKKQHVCVCVGLLCLCAWTRAVGPVALVPKQ